MTTANLDAANLAGVAVGGLINESVMAKIWDISKIPLPFQDRIASGPADNSYHEWTQDALQAPDKTNATIDGADAGTTNTNTGARVGNHCQIPDKVVRVSDRARNSKTIGFADTLEYQLMMRQQELMRDIEVISLEPQASLADTGAAAGTMGGFPSWLTTNAYRGVGGSDGGFAAGIVAAPTAGTGRALTETLVRTAASDVYDGGGDPSVLMSTTEIIRGLSAFMFTADAQIATLQRNESGSVGSAMGSVNVFYTDFGVTLEMVGHRLMTEYATDAANVLIFDPSHVQTAFLKGVHVEEIARTGTAENRQMTADVTVVVGTETAHAVVADVNGGLAVTA